MHLLFTLTERIKKIPEAANISGSGGVQTRQYERMQVLAAGSKVRNFLALWAAIMLQTSEPTDTRRVMKGFADSFETPRRGYLFAGSGF